MGSVDFLISDTTDLSAVRCTECWSIDFEYTKTRKFCVRCGLVAIKLLYSSVSTSLKEAGL